MIKNIVILILLLAVVLALYLFGRSIWRPILTKVKGKESVDSIVKKYSPSVEERLYPNLIKLGFETYPEQIRILAFKEEQRLEVLVLKEGAWRKFKEYDFTGYSGQLGPKLKQGDLQIPEGIYYIEYLNPNSSYHLSLKVSYPNDFDRKKAKLENRTNLGGDIFIHGKSVTIGCIPLGDEAIEEVFLLATHALNNGIKVIISPKDFRKNKAFPEIESVEWEDELYKLISSELEKYPVFILE